MYLSFTEQGLLAFARPKPFLKIVAGIASTMIESMAVFAPKTMPLAKKVGLPFYPVTLPLMAALSKPRASMKAF